jgi:long-chain acyl-CoA synthetase
MFSRPIAVSPDLKARGGWATLRDASSERAGAGVDARDRARAKNDEGRVMYIDASDLVLDRAYAWERQKPEELFMVQPVGGGQVRLYNWEKTLDEARRVAAYLQSFGFPPGSKIAILSKNCAQFVMSDLAIWMAGYVSVGLYPTLQPHTVRYILDHSEAKLLFVGKLDDWDGMKPGVPDDLPCISYPLSPPNDYPTWDDIVRTTQPIAGEPKRTPDETALLVYTSGSTGKPKGVELSFRNVAAAGKGFSSGLGLTKRDRFLSYLPLAHVFERGAIESTSLYVGAQIYFAETLDTFVADVKRARPTVFHSVPRLWLKFQLGVFAKLPEQRLARLLKLPIVRTLVRKQVLKGLGLDSAWLAISGSAPIPPEIIEWYRTLGLELREGYGMSENFAYSHVSQKGKVRAGYVGNTLPGVECKLGENSEVLVKSPTDMKSYYKEPEMTRASYTADGFLKTGDRGEIDAEGRLKITGRVKELFKTSKGKYVAPAVVENLLNADSHVELSCVSGEAKPNPYALLLLSDQLRASLKNGAPRSAVDKALQELLARVNVLVEEHEQLAFLVVVKDTWQVENGFLTPTLKIKRSALEESYAPKVNGWYERKQRVIWED